MEGIIDKILSIIGSRSPVISCHSAYDSYNDLQLEKALKILESLIRGNKSCEFLAVIC